MPLFLPTSDDIGFLDDYAENSANCAPPKSNLEAYDFELDNSIFDIRSPSPSSPAVRSMSTEASTSTQSVEPAVRTASLKLCDSQRPLQETNIHLNASMSKSRIEPAQQSSKLGLSQDPPQADPFQDDLAELEAWLASDAVVIVDHLD